MVKRALTIFIFVFSFVVFSCKANALVPLCLYDDYSGQSSDGIELYVGDAFTYLNVDNDPNSTFRSIASVAAVSGAVLAPGYALYNTVTSTQISTDFMRNQIYDTGTNYRFGNGSESLIRIDENGNITNDKYDAEYEGLTKSKFTSGGICPEYIIYDGGIDQVAFKGQYIFKEDLNDVDTNSFLSGLAGNKIYKLNYSLLSGDFESLESQFNSCVTDTSLINNVRDVLAATYSENVAEQSKIDGYISNNYSRIIPIINLKYVEGGECFDIHTMYQDEYKKLTDSVKKFDSLRNNSIGQQDINECDQIINGKFGQHLNTILKFIQYLGPILTIVLSSVEYFKAMVSSDSDAMKKVNNKTVVRLIFTLLLFFIPLFIRVLLGVFGFDSSCSVLH